MVESITMRKTVMTAMVMILIMSVSRVDMLEAFEMAEPSMATVPALGRSSAIWRMWSTSVWSTVSESTASKR